MNFSQEEHQSKHGSNINEETSVNEDQQSESEPPQSQFNTMDVNDGKPFLKYIRACVRTKYIEEKCIYVPV